MTDCLVKCLQNDVRANSGGFTCADNKIVNQVSSYMWIDLRARAAQLILVVVHCQTNHQARIQGHPPASQSGRNQFGPWH